MTIEMCLAACQENGFRYAGLEWQIECYCGDEPVQGFEWTWIDKCNNRCAGNSNQICEGSLAMSVYTCQDVHRKKQGLDIMKTYQSEVFE